MRFVSLVKLGLKSALVLAIATSILVTLHGLPGRDNDDSTTNTGDNYHQPVRIGSVVNLQSSTNRDESYSQTPKGKLDVDFDVVQSDSSGDGESFNLSQAYRESLQVWEMLDKSSQFTLRYWDLVRSVNPEGAFHNDLGSLPVMDNTEEVPNLWRPPFSSLSVDVSNRIIPQLVMSMEPPYDSEEKKSATKKIVVGDSFRWWSKFDWPSGSHQLNAQDCKKTPESETRCIFYDSLSEVHNADAVITPRDSFHTSEVHVPPGVLRFYFILESPFHSWVTLNRSEDLLATYWRGSDLVTPYAAWAYYDNNVKSKYQGKDYSLGKSKPGAIFVSNCGSWNGRMNYIRELQKYIQIDVYGNCGTLSCEKRRGKDCFDMLKKDYYFYFSFENSNCRDYITEKLYQNGLENDVIPIVLGAHPDDYKAMAPHYSYLHVENFETPKQLAERMKFLMNNPTEYNKYFEWKGTGEFITSDLFCRLCGMVHYADIVPPPKRTQPYRWGHKASVESGMCLPADRWYWTRENK